MKCLAWIAGATAFLACTCAASAATEQMHNLSKQLIAIRALHPSEPVRAPLYGTDTRFLIGLSKGYIFQYSGMPDVCWAATYKEPCVSATGWAYIFSKSPPGWFGSSLSLDLEFSEKATVKSAKWQLGR
jgi:hypothetical protein